MNEKIKIMHILAYGDMGGAQNLVLSTCHNYNRNRYEITVCILFSGGIISDKIAASGHEVIILNMTNGFDLIRAFRLITLIRRRKIDIVHIHARNPLGKLCSILSGAPVIIHTDHGTTISSPLRRKQRVVLSTRLLAPFIHHFIAVSRGMKESLRLRERINDKKISLIYNGVDVKSISSISCDKEKLKQSLNIPLHIPVLGTVGRLSPEKQYPLLFESLSVLKKDGVEFLTLVVGDGPERVSLKGLVQTLNLNDCVSFLGERDDVAMLLEIMDVFVFPSGGEAFSLSVLEAMAKAKPVVAFDVEGLNETVVSGQNGFLVPFGNVDEFAEKTKILLQSSDLALRMGQSGFERVSAMYDLRKNIQKMEALYEGLLKKNTRK